MCACNTHTFPINAVTYILYGTNTYKVNNELYVYTVYVSFLFSGNGFYPVQRILVPQGLV